MTSRKGELSDSARRTVPGTVCLVVIVLGAGCSGSTAKPAADAGLVDMAATPDAVIDVGVDLATGGADSADDLDDATPSPDTPEDDAGTDAMDAEAAHDPGPSVDTWAPRDVLAQRMSMFFWNRADVDAQLAASVQAAGSADELAGLARAMLQDPRARDGVTAFFTWWLRLTDLATLPKDDPDGIFTPDVRASLQREAPAFGAGVILDGDGRYETLMTAPYTFMDATLAQHYGVPGVTGSDMQKVDFGTPARIGLLGEASVLARFAGNTNPTWPPRRFWMIRQTVLCRRGLSSAVPIDTSAFVISPSQTLRAQLDSLTAATSPVNCHACHVIVNPIGDAFLKFNTFGQYWDTGPAGPFDDASGTIPPGVYFDQSLTFTDQPDLLRQLQALPEARECFAWIALNFAVVRPTSSETTSFSSALEPSLTGLAADFESSDGDIRALMVNIVRTPAFLQTATPAVTDGGLSGP